MRTILLATAVLLALASSVGADHCDGSTTSWPEVDTGDLPGVGRYYFENDLCNECVFTVWVYEESNGIDGLQRADEFVDDTCHGSIRGDTIIF